MRILLTGATSGIGYELAINLIKRNHFVILTSHSEKERQNLVKKLSQLPYSNYICKKLDITDKKEVEEILKLDFDCLVNQAGIGIGGSILDLPIEKVKENFEVNFFSSFYLLQQFVSRQIKNNKPGKVIITSSLLSILPLPFLGSYASSKAAISMMAECLRLELKKSKYPITIKLIEPGAYKTGFNQIMINNKEKNIEKSFLFKDIIYDEIKKQNKMFNLLEKKTLTTIVNKMTKAIESKSKKLKYRAPLLQVIGAKLYLIFIK